MKASQVLVAALLAAAVAAAAAWYLHFRPISNAQALVRSQLKDPESARFRNTEIHANGIVCGEVNAKNAMGGYTGFRPFAASAQGVAVVAPLDTEYAAVREAFRIEFDEACRR